MSYHSDDGRSQQASLNDETFVVECVIAGVNLLLPFSLTASVAAVADRAYEEYQIMHPRAPPMKIMCVCDEHGRILSRALLLGEHELAQSTFQIQVEEYSAADMITVPQQLGKEYRRWQLWTVRQIYDSIKAALTTQFARQSLEMLRDSQELLPRGASTGTGTGGSDSSGSAVDTELLDLLSELCFSPDAAVKLLCLETLALVRLQDRNAATAATASARITRFILEEKRDVDVVVYGLHAFRTNAKGLLPLSPFHEREVSQLHNLFRIDAFNDVLARFPDREHQRQLMLAYKSMYIHHYDVSVDKMHKGGGQGADGSDGYGHGNKAMVGLRASNSQYPAEMGGWSAGGHNGGFYGPSSGGTQGQSEDHNHAAVRLSHDDNALSFEAPALSDAGMPLQAMHSHSNAASQHNSRRSLGIEDAAVPLEVLDADAGLDGFRKQAPSSSSAAPTGALAPAAAAQPTRAGDVHQRAMAAAGMTVSRICNLLVSEERSVWSFAVSKLHVLLTTTRASAEQAQYAELLERRLQRREVVAKQKHKIRAMVRLAAHEKAVAEMEKAMEAKRVASAADNEKAKKAKLEKEAAEKAAAEAKLAKLGDKGRARVEREQEEKARLADIEKQRRIEAGEWVEEKEPEEERDPLDVEQDQLLAQLTDALHEKEQRDEEAYLFDRRSDNESTFAMSSGIAAYTDYRPLFLSNGEVDLLASCLFDALKASIDTRAKGVLSGSMARGAFGSSSGSSGGYSSDAGRVTAEGFVVPEAPKAKQLIEAALVSPLTDLPSVRRIVDCLYMLALPMRLDPSADVEHPLRSTFTSTLQVSVAKVCLARARLLLTLCHAESNVLAGKCAFLLHLAVRFNAKNRRENTSRSDNKAASTSLDDGWAGLDLKVNPDSLVAFLMAHNKAVKVEVQGSNFNRNAFDSHHSSSERSNSKKDTGKGAEVDEDDEEEQDVHSKHLVNLSLDYLFSLSQVHDNGSAQAIAASSGRDKERVRHGKAISRKESGDLDMVLSEANLVKGYFRDADRAFSNKDGGDGGHSEASMSFSDLHSDMHAPTAPKRGDRSSQSNSGNPAKGLKRGARAVKESEKLLERVFLGDHYAYLLRLWHLANNSTALEEAMPCYRDRNVRRFRSEKVMQREELSEFREAQALLLDYSVSMQARRVAMEILSHLCTLSTAFRDQLMKINAIPKLIVLAGSPGIVVCSGADYAPYQKHSRNGNVDLSEGAYTAGAAATEEEEKAAAEQQQQQQQQQQLQAVHSDVSLSEVSSTDMVADPAAYKLDLSTVRALLRLLLNLVVMQSPKKQATICRLLTQVPVGGKRHNMELRTVSQTDESCAFYYATLQSFQFLHDETEN